MHQIRCLESYAQSHQIFSSFQYQGCRYPVLRQQHSGRDGEIKLSPPCSFPSPKRSRGVAVSPLCNNRDIHKSIYTFAHHSQQWLPGIIWSWGKGKSRGNIRIPLGTLPWAKVKEAHTEILSHIFISSGQSKEKHRLYSTEMLSKSHYLFDPVGVFTNHGEDTGHLYLGALFKAPGGDSLQLVVTNQRGARITLWRDCKITFRIILPINFCSVEDQGNPFLLCLYSICVSLQILWTREMESSSRSI